MTETEEKGKDRYESVTDPSKFRPSPKEFQCGEELEDGGGIIGRTGVSFFCTLPKNKESGEGDDGKSPDDNRLTFTCRDRSSGVLESEESAITNDEFEATQNACSVDPFFFDEGYTLAGRTGFQVWSVSESQKLEWMTRFFSYTILRFVLIPTKFHLACIGDKVND